MNSANIINEIVTRVKENFKIKSIFLFGSSVSGNLHEDSDIDLLIILDEPGIANEFMEVVKRRNNVTKLLLDIRKKVALDILVYTKDEWDLLKKDRSSFVREIMENGKKVA